MARSGWVRVRESGRQKIYTLAPALSEALMSETHGAGQWTFWAPVFRYLEALWFALHEPRFSELNPMMQTSELRRVLSTLQKRVADAGFAEIFATPAPPLGADYLTFALQTAKDLLSALDE